MITLSSVSVDNAVIQKLIRNCFDTISKIEKTRQNLISKYQSLGASWSDSKYKYLGTIIEDCSSAINKVSKELQECAQKLEQVNVYIQEYESVNFNGSGNVDSEINQILQTASSNAIRENSTSGSTQSINSISNWLPEINPNFNGDPFSPFSSNCGSCALAVFRRMSGDLSATATIRTLSIQEMNSSTGRTQIAMTPSQISEYLITQGTGSFGVVGVDRSNGPGHWFNAYYDGQNVYAIDGQTGEIQNWPPDYGNIVYWDFSI